jgi:ABC-2 type transport system ATP-binding protein
MHVLRVDGVKKHFRNDMSPARHEVLHGISFHAREGEILGFLGPNGAGKTTTIKVILGLIRADAGSVAIFDRPVGDRKSMARIGYLPEMPYFYPHLSLEEFLGFCGALSGVAAGELTDRVAKAVETVDLAAHRERRLKTFSKGMLQRAGLAQAILHDPDLLILDEPFSGLDPVGRKMVRDVLIDLRNRGKTIFFSSHILPDMEALCDRVCIIRDGIIVKSIGIPELVKLGEGAVEVTATHWRPGMFSGIEPYVSVKRETGEEVFLIVRERRFVRSVIEQLYAAGAEVLEVAGERRSLEDLFMKEISRPARRTKSDTKEEKLVFTGF